MRRPAASAPTRRSPTSPSVLALGLTRVAMSRDIGSERHRGASVMSAGARGRGRADVLHGHGAKGGAYARLARATAAPSRVYTPHGGSLHYRWGSPAGLVYLTAENVLTTAHRSVPVRERLRPRHLRRQGRRPGPTRWCASCTTASPMPNSCRSRPRRTRPIWSSSANCASSRASTC